jgi:hypothetical protein
MGLARPICALIMGLDVILVGFGRLIPEIGYPPVIIGDEAAELTVEPGIDIGTATGRRGPDSVRTLRIGETREGCVSRR